MALGFLSPNHIQVCDLILIILLQMKQNVLLSPCHLAHAHTVHIQHTFQWNEDRVML